MRGSTVWVPALNDCVISHTSQFRWGITANFITDMVLLSVMFAGVLSKRNATGLWRVLYIQVSSHPFRSSESRNRVCLNTFLRVLHGFWLQLCRCCHLLYVTLFFQKDVHDAGVDRYWVG